MKQRKRTAAYKSYKDSALLHLRQTVATVLFATLCGVMPLVVLDGYRNITQVKSILVWTFSAAALVSIIALRLIAPITLNDAPRRGWEAAVLVLGLVAVISSFLSPYQDIVYWGIPGRFDGLVTWICYLSCALIIQRYCRLREAHLYFLCAVFVFLFGVGVAQLLRYNPFDLYPINYNLYISSFLTLLGNFNIVSNVSVCMGLFFLGLLLDSSHKLCWPFWCGYLSCIGLLLIANSSSGGVGLFSMLFLLLPYCAGSRLRLMQYAQALTAMGLMGLAFPLMEHIVVIPQENSLSRLVLLLMGFCVMLGIILYFVGKMSAQKVWRGALLRRSVAAAYIVCVAGVLAFLLTAENLSGTLYEFREILRGNLQNSFMSYRGFIWRYGLPLFFSHPLFGSGPDTFGAVFEGTYPGLAVSLMGTYVDKAHNEYLQILITLGAAGLLAYGTVLTLSFRNWLKQMRSTFRPEVFAAGLAAAGYLLQAFFNISTPIAAPFLWCMLGLCAQAE